MRALLLYPPIGSLTQPYLSLPTLTAELRQRGHTVDQVDVGIIALDRLLESESIQRLGRVAESRYAGLSIREIPDVDRVRVRIASSMAPLIASRIASAKRTLRSKSEFYIPEAYRTAANTVKAALDIISAAYYPVRIIFNDYDLRIPGDYASALSLAEDAEPFSPILRQDIIPALAVDSYDLVGISATYYHQLAPSLRLARTIKNLHPTAFVALGGAAVTSAEASLRREEYPFDFVDAYAFGEGEAALCWLLESDRTIDRRTPPNLLLRPGGPAPALAQPESDRPYVTRPFAKMATPDYSGLNMGDYLSPEPVPLLANARGCYHRKCAFCNVSLAYMDRFDQRDVPTVLNDIRKVQTDTGASIIYFADDCISPKRCVELATAVRCGSIDIKWLAEARFEHAFSRQTLELLADGGCRGLVFGNESASQRVLDLMNKRVSVDDAQRIISEAFEFGIPVHLQNFIGFPGETLEEAEETVSFLLSERRRVASYALGLFHVTEHSPIQRDPVDFDTSGIRLRRKADLVPSYKYRHPVGTASQWRGKHAASIGRLSRGYPLQGFFLDGPLSAHMMLFMSKLKSRTFDDLFGSFEWQNDLLRRRPSLQGGYEFLEVEDDVLLVGENSSTTYLTRAEYEFVTHMDGGARLDELCLDLARRMGAHGRRRVTVMAHFAIMAVDLWRAGVIRLDIPTTTKSTTQEGVMSNV